VLSSGGRVLGVSAIAPTVKEAQAAAYQAVDAIDWPEGFCRRDIAWRAVGR
jgi:phosphoribosylamine---glycine ligase